MWFAALKPWPLSLRASSNINWSLTSVCPKHVLTEGICRLDWEAGLHGEAGADEYMYCMSDVLSGRLGCYIQGKVEMMLQTKLELNFMAVNSSSCCYHVYAAIEWRLNFVWSIISTVSCM